MNTKNTEALLQQMVEFIPRFHRMQRHISPTTQSVLLALVEHGALNLTELARIRAVKKSTMSVMMEQLVYQHLVIKARSKTDRRQHIYMLSRHGRDQLDDEWQFKQEWLTANLQGFSQEQIDQCAQMLWQLSTAIMTPVDDS